MNSLIEWFVTSIVVVILGWIMIVSLYAMFALIPVKIYTKSVCLKQGYPAAIVDWKLNTYCTTLDGAVTLPVIPQ